MKKEYKDFIIFFIFVLLCIIVITNIFFGNPNSERVNIIGRNLQNFVEYEKIDAVCISNIDISMIVCFRRTHGDKSYLTLRNLYNDSDETVFIGHHGNFIDYVFFDINNSKFVYTLRDIRRNRRRTYLVTYDLETMKEINSFILADSSEYRNERTGRLSGILFDEVHSKMYFGIRYDSNFYDSSDFFSIEVLTGEIEQISLDMYLEIRDNPGIHRNSNFFVSDDITKELFFISPNSVFLSSNFKHKYNGTYINDGSNNVRISTSPIALNNRLSKVFWIQNGKYVIFGSHIYDTSGKKRAIRIADGEILAVY